MTDRLKYFLLGLLFLVVAGVIAFDRWNSRDALLGSAEDAARTAREDGNRGETTIIPPIDKPIDKKKSSPLEIKPGPVRPLDDLPDREPESDEQEDRPAPIPGRRPETSANKTHVVKSGETLEAISRQYYPGKVHAGIQLIASANKIENLNRIRERQKLVIPTMDTRGTRKPQLKRVKNGSPVPSTYTVLSSDGDLYSICRRYYGRKGEGRRIKEIMALNGLWSANVKSGTVLKLPPR